MTQAAAPTADTVRRLVRSLLPDGGAVEIGPAGDGAPFTWLVGARYVLRLAPDRDAGTALRRELRLRELVRPHAGVAVPATVAHGEWADGLPCALDTRIPDGPGEYRTVSALGEADLAGLLSGLREVPVRQAETLGVPRVRPRSLESLKVAAAGAAERLRVADEFDPARLRQLTGAAAVQLGGRPDAAVLVHHGLGEGHLLVGADGRVCGVADWTGAVVGDPAEDIAGLALAVGAPAAVRAATLAGYGARPCLRGLWLARCEAVVRLADRLRGRTEEPLPALRARLRHAWEAILLERLTDLPDEGPL
ncbi:hypothetical protein GCM10010358_65070 [Streptomyces minutiscleroticus]|uniref:Aminoglycoside phosphotransferase domain-containing protein n=1 Tax=Streptomyces minutiscleroticus TaxID=68238 RepID=A0A918NWC5_9ACTN|nr:aminoglycoside phosphotransferase family protein [Streptomyces minutiscleroticus]GGY02120.1 hypothetical protein GCM10010358_65070 [Streptomyces minutiscleroticus]